VLSDQVSRIVSARVNDPGAIEAAAARRVRATSLLGEHGKAVIIAADHPARGANGVGGDPTAMADRSELLDRLCVALERPGVTGVLGTADILEDLLLLGVLDGKSVFGSMNRAGLAGSVFEIDDRLLPVVDGMERVLAASTLPALLLGGEVTDAGAAFASWGRALRLPTAQGLVVGRSLLYPAGGDVAGAVSLL
jgi:hypothetical protein